MGNSDQQARRVGVERARLLAYFRAVSWDLSIVFVVEQ